MDPGVETVGDGLRERISRRVAFLIGRVVGVAKTSGSVLGMIGRASLLGEVMIGTAPNFAKFSTGGGLDRVGFGFIFDRLGSSRRPPPIGLFSKVPRADSALNSHLTIVSLTEIRKCRIEIF